MRSRQAEPRGERPAERPPLADHYSMVERALPAIAAMGRYFRYEVRGLSRLPAEGGALLVSPHSSITVDNLMLGKAILETRGRLIRGLADHRIFKVPGLREFAQGIGMVDGTRDSAVRMLRSGELCISLPGGADEAFKASRYRYQLRWRHRTGFVRVALRAGVPIIPVVCIGVDDALWLPFNATEWGRRILRMPIPIFTGFGLGLMPLPVKLTAYIGEPLELGGRPADADDDAFVHACRDRVMGATRELIQYGLAQRTSKWR